MRADYKMSVTLLIFSVAIAVSRAEAAEAAAAAKSPHIVLIVGDDVGFNDFTLRGSEDVPTPNIDSLGYSGRILDRHYTLPTCSPSRASLLTGYHAVRTGLQGYPLKIGEPTALPLNFTLIPEYLRRLNYSTHLVGKWHLGFHRWAYTPTYRGFDSFLGCYNGYIGYSNHEVAVTDWQGDPKERPNGYDLHRNEAAAFDLRGRYVTEVFTEEAERIIWEHDEAKPLFLQVSHLATHTSEEPNGVEVSNEAANNRRFGFIADPRRRRLAGAMAALDDSVGRVVRALAERDMLSDSLIVFLADNGAPTTGRSNNTGSNWPLRGQKFALFDGAVRTAAVAWHAGMKPTSELHTDYIHITDWLPTFYEAAGGNVSDLGDIDGVSQWGRLSGTGTGTGADSQPAPRTELFVTSDENAVAAYIDKGWKLVIGANTEKSTGTLSGDPGRTAGAQPYNLCGVVNSPTARFLAQASPLSDFQRLGERAARLRALSTLPATCRQNATQQAPKCTAGCLYNLNEDPCETNNLVDAHPEVVSSLLLKVRQWESKAVPMLNTAVDMNSNPARFGGAWVPWMDVQPSTVAASPSPTTTPAMPTPVYGSANAAKSCTEALIALAVIWEILR